eukprot:7601034-Karenia_brevis.AAC.1
MKNVTSPGHNPLNPPRFSKDVRFLFEDVPEFGASDHHHITFDVRSVRCRHIHEHLPSFRDLS